MSVAIDCNEMRKVVTVDNPGLYLQSKLQDDEQVFVVLRGRMAELLCQTDPKKYRPHMKFCKSRKEYILCVWSVLYLRTVKQSTIRISTGITLLLGGAVVLPDKSRI